MYIVAIGWAYVILMLAITASSWVKALAIVIFLGVAPLALSIYVFDRPRRRRLVPIADQETHQRNAANPQTDQQ